MNSEKLLDALSLLPDDLLEATDALRSRKVRRWRSWAALAACACLAAGLLFLAPISKTNDSNGGMDPMEQGSGFLSDESSVQENSSTCCVTATVKAVYEDRLVVTISSETAPREVTVLLEKVNTVPSLSPGQTVRIYLTDPKQAETDTLMPCKIETEEELP